MPSWITVVVVLPSFCLGLLIFAAHVEPVTGRLVSRSRGEVVAIIVRCLRGGDRCF
ncbi:MAG TPA: hypothetical protein VGG24_20330 [Paraburkholderia sp.]|jgi:hypothetical protein